MRTGNETAGRRAGISLQASGFIIADLRAGIGPFTGVFLQGRGCAIGPAVFGITIGVWLAQGFGDGIAFAMQSFAMLPLVRWIGFGRVLRQGHAARDREDSPEQRLSAGACA